MKLSKAACLAALLGAALTTSAMADEWNKKTVVTFSGPVEIPGVHVKGWDILPAGTYVFKLVNSPSDRHIVQIFNKDETVVHATVLAVPNYRLKPTGKTVITFHERPAGQPEAIRAWFYPGATSGEEFVYGKKRAMDMAKDHKTPVMFTQIESVESSEPLTTETPAVAEMRSAPLLAYNTAGDEVAVSEVVEPLPASAETAMAELPRTASVEPMIAMLGLIALAGATGMTILRKRV